MYKIGDKVETPHGTGWVRGYSEVYDMYIVDLKGAFKNQQYKPLHLLPYRTIKAYNSYLLKKAKDYFAAGHSEAPAELEKLEKETKNNDK